MNFLLNFQIGEFSAQLFFAASDDVVERELHSRVAPAGAVSLV